MQGSGRTEGGDPPLYRAPTDCFVHAQYAELLFELAVEKGANPRELLQLCGIRESLLRDPAARLSLVQLARLVVYARRLSGDKALGIAFGHRLKFTSHGPLAQLAVSSDTLGQAIDAVLRYHRIRIDWIDLRFFEDGDDAVLALSPQVDLGPLLPFVIECLFVSLMEANALLFGTRLLIEGSCRVAYPAPSWAEAYRAVFYDGITFAAGTNQLRFKRQLLGLPMVLANPVTRRLAEQACASELAEIDARIDAVQDRLERVIRELLQQRQGRPPDMDEVAERLGLSSRTLRRQLQSRGTRFQALLDEVRRTQACEWLMRTEQSVDDIAHRLGYSDASNFGRAFRRWLGCSPSQWREQQRTDTPLSV